MKRVAILGGLLGLALIGSYTTWKGGQSMGDTLPADTVYLTELNPDEISKITWVSELNRATLTRRQDAKGAYILVDTTVTIPAVEGENPSPSRTRTNRFTGNQAAHRVWEVFARLPSLRTLSIPEGSTLADFGLDPAEGSITVETSSGPVVLNLGKDAYGARDRYISKGDDLFLVQGDLLYPLSAAPTQLPERRLSPLNTEDVLSITLANRKQSRTAVQRNGKDEALAFWADATSPDRADLVVSGWAAQVLELRVQGYLEEGEALPEALSPLAAITIAGEDGEWKATLLKDEATGDFYVDSEHLRTSARLTSKTAELVEALPAIFEAAPEE